VHRICEGMELYFRKEMGALQSKLAASGLGQCADGADEGGTACQEADGHKQVLAWGGEPNLLESALTSPELL